VQRLLLVDDDATFLEVMRRSMRSKGFEVRTALDADSACKAAQEYLPTHILLDLNLPGDSGLVTLPRLRKLAPGARIVVLTGYSSIATAVEAMKLGATDYLCKPARVAEILDAFAGTSHTPAKAIAEQPMSVNRLEWEHIQKILQQQGGNVSATAKALGMHRRTLQRKLQKKPVRQ